MKSSSANPVSPFSRIKYLDPTNPSQEEILIQTRLLDLVRLRIAHLRAGPKDVDLLKNALAALGETPGRIEGIAAWQGSALYSERECAAFALAEGLIAEPPVPVSLDVIGEARNHFNDAEMIHLVLTIFSSNDRHHQEERASRSYDPERWDGVDI
jgi:alkylhydroperoxidase family enzyme